MLQNISFKDILIAIIKAVDIINPILKNHHRRTAIIAYNLGLKYGLSEEKLANLVVAASLHDVGALTVEDAKALLQMDVENPKPHSELGYKILSSYKGFDKVSKIIKNHHIKYSDYDETIPEECLFLHLADRVEILLNNQYCALSQAEKVIDKIAEYPENLFKPELVDTLRNIADKDIFWLDIDTLTVEQLIKNINMKYVLTDCNYEELESLVLTTARIIDYKSSFTVTHSIGVAFVASALAELCNFNEEKCQEIKIAGYLHDIGKIAIPSEIISKPGKLNKLEYSEMKSHAYYTAKILQNIKGLENITKWAACHHETIDGTGYPMKLSGKEIPKESLILAYADVFTALAENRPYRKGLPIDKVLTIMSESFRYKLDSDIFEIIWNNADYLNNIRKYVQTESYNNYIKST